MGNDTHPIFIDLFAGAGGFGLGFKLSGYCGICSLEIDDWAADTLRYNDHGMKIIHGDIRAYQSDESIKDICTSKPHIIIGGPPCQGFSIAGQADPKDPRNSLFKDYARWVSVLEPQIFIMENVKGLLGRKNSNGESVIEIIKRTFIDLGYSIELWILNSAEYGVPQIRERIFIVGNRLGIERIGPPKKTNIISSDIYQENAYQQGFLEGFSYLPPALTIWDAISDLPQLEAGEGNEEQPYSKTTLNQYQEWARGKQQILFNHVAMEHSARLVERFRHVGWGESSADVPIEHRARIEEWEWKNFRQNVRSK